MQRAKTLTFSTLRAAMLVVLVAWTLISIAAPSAFAHATLVSSNPENQETVEHSPKQITLVFSGSVVSGKGSIRVFTPDGKEIQRGLPKPSSGRTIHQPIQATGNGTHFVSYLVSSEDGHIINGSFQFSIGKPTTKEDLAGKNASTEASTVSKGLQLGFSIARFVEVIMLLTIAGGGIFACMIAPGWQPRILMPAMTSLLLAYVAGYVFTSAILHGGMTQGLQLSALEATSHTPFGRSTLLRASFSLFAIMPSILLLGSPRLARTARTTLTTVFVALAASLAISGHAVTTAPIALRLPLDMLHVIAASIWLGGLVQLGFLAPFASTWIAEITRFSRLAFVSVLVILITGASAAVMELDTGLTRDLIESTYGRLILAKLALYLATMPLAWNNMSAFVPAISRRPSDAPKLLRQYVWRELFFVVVIVVLTIWLIATPQP